MLLFRQSIVVVLLGAFLFALQLFAFTEPTSSPPSGNTPAPLNTGSSGQSKSGGLILNTGGAAIGLIVDKGNVGVGTAGPQAKLEVAGDFIRTIARATGYGPDDETDTGRIISRTLTFLKRQTDTGIRVGYTDNWRVVSTPTGSDSSCRWEIRFNDASCTNPGPLTYTRLMKTSISNHDPTSVFGTCFGIPAGSASIQIWVNAVGSSNCHTGWERGYWSIEVEEVR